MSKTVTIHQPNYLAWIGLFSKIALADTLVIYDTAQYTMNSVINRNKIRTGTGWCYLTVPVSHRFHDAPIRDVALPENDKWQKDHWKTISQYYSHAENFGCYRERFEGIYNEKFQYLWQINEGILLALLDCFEVKAEVVRASELGIDPSLKGTDALIACLTGTGANTYISGPSGKDYLEPEKFKRDGIALEFFRFEHPVYPQRYAGFEPNMAAIDLLFNVGRQSGEIVKKSGSIEA